METQPSAVRRRSRRRWRRFKQRWAFPLLVVVVAVVVGLAIAQLG